MAGPKCNGVALIFKGLVLVIVLDRQNRTAGREAFALQRDNTGS